MYNHLKVAFRNLIKYPTLTLIHILGLALGITACLIIFCVVRFESSFDDFHEKKNRTYRVNLKQQSSGRLMLSGYNFYPLGDAIRENIQGLEHVTQMHYDNIYQVKINDDIFEGKSSFFVDDDFFKVFDTQWILGNPEHAFNTANSAVVTDEFAIKYFGGPNEAIGKLLLYENKIELIVNGVVAKPPPNTDLPYTILAPYEAFSLNYPVRAENWEQVHGGATFIVKQEKTSESAIRSQLKSLVEKFIDSEVYTNTEFTLMALDDNHDRNYDYNSFTYDFPVPVMFILSIMAGMILLAGCINYINLATAQGFNRAKEVGIRKTSGGSRAQLVIQFFTETLLLTFITVCLAAVLTSVGMTLLNQNFNYPAFEINLISDFQIMLFLSVLLVVVAVLAGFYPAVVLSGYKPILALKGKVLAGLDSAGRYRKFSYRSALVVLQFIIAQMLILLTLVVYNHMQFLNNRPLGFNHESVVIAFIPGMSKNVENINRLHTFREKLKRYPEIMDVSYYSSNLESIYYRASKANSQRNPGVLQFVDHNFIKNYELQIVAGEPFKRDVNSNKDIIVNQTLLKTLDIDDPSKAIGSVLSLNDQDMRIIGVVKDYYYRGTLQRIKPFVLRFDESRSNIMAIRISNDQVSKAMKVLESNWKSSFPEYLFRYNFLENLLKSQNNMFSNLLKVFLIASVLSIIIGALGIYGLAYFMTIHRLKEIVLRKIFGAGTFQIMSKFNLEYLVLIIIAFIISAPISSYIGNRLLDEFPEKYQQGVGIFLIALAVSLLTVALSVGYKLYQAIRINPSIVLKHE